MNIWKVKVRGRCRLSGIGKIREDDHYVVASGNNIEEAMNFACCHTEATAEFGPKWEHFEALEAVPLSDPFTLEVKRGRILAPGESVMGMFDYVKIEPPVKCRGCGKELGLFQSKDLECTMATVPYWRCTNFYTHCDHCDMWHEFVLKDHGERPLSDYRLLISERGGRAEMREVEAPGSQE